LNTDIIIFQQKIENASYFDIIFKIEKNIAERNTFFFHYVNFFILLESLKNTKLNNNLFKFDSLFADGIGVFWASRIIYGKRGLTYRITGTDLYYKILANAEKNNYSCFFLGGSKKASELLRENLLKKYPRLKIKGILSGNMESVYNEIDRIRESKADILFVGLGTPDQEKWLVNNYREINIPVQLCVGSGIEFLSGVRKRAPAFLRKIGLEWIHRLILEPKRLWKRYIIGIPVFIFKVIIFKYKLLIKK